MKRKIVSLCLIAVLCISLLSVVKAEEPAEAEAIEAQEDAGSEDKIAEEEPGDIEAEEGEAMEGESEEGESEEGESEGESTDVEEGGEFVEGAFSENDEGESEGESAEEAAEGAEGAEEGESEEGESEEGESEEGEIEEGESAEGEFVEIDFYDEENADGKPEAVQAFIVVRGFEWGPGVNKVVLELDEPVDEVLTEKTIRVSTAFWDRTVLDAYLSNRMGYAVEGSSRYITFDLETDYEHNGSPFFYNLMGDQHNYWLDDYTVSIRVSVREGEEEFKIRYEDNCIDNHFSPDVVAFNKQGVYSGNYFNVMTFKTDTLSLNFAIYQPESLAGGEKNPLIIWLHGRGEGGDDIEITLLGYEVSALTETEIQSHFISGDQVGAYILVPQTPTYWRDAGDDKEHEGDMPSRYQKILMDLITDYIEENPDIDTNRIYIMGASNGGFMTLEMIENYPDFFAAAIPVSPATAYNVYARDDDGDYRDIQGNHVETGDVYITEDKIELLKQTPIWIIGCAKDNITPPLSYSAPLYYALIKGGAENCWCTMYQKVKGTESSNTTYLGHYAWIYLFNDQVCYVQDPEPVAEADEDTFYYGLSPAKDGGDMQVPDGNGGFYDNIFDWLNDQTLE